MIGRVLGLVVPMELGDLSARTVSLKVEHSIPSGGPPTRSILTAPSTSLVSGILLVPSALFILGAVGPSAGLAIAGVGFVAGLVCFALFGSQTIGAAGGRSSACSQGDLQDPRHAEAGWTPRRRRKALAVAELRVGGPEALPAERPQVPAHRACASRRWRRPCGIGVGVADILLFAPGAQFALVFSVTPGGLGVVDWSWSGLLYKIGVPKHDIVPYLISLRAAVLVSVLVLARLEAGLQGPVSAEGAEAA